MKNKPIIAAWISPARLHDYTLCNQVLNIVLIFVKWALNICDGREVGEMIFSLSGVSHTLYYTFFNLCGIGMIVLGLVFCVLSVLGHIGGIDLKRSIWLMILGIINLFQSVLILGR